MVTKYENNYESILNEWRAANLLILPLKDRLTILRKLVFLTYKTSNEWTADLKEFETARAWEIEDILNRLGDRYDASLIQQLKSEIEQFSDRTIARSLLDSLPSRKQSPKPVFEPNKYVMCPKGEFQMGNIHPSHSIPQLYNYGKTSEYNNAEPRHTVRISYDFYLAKYPVTRGEFSKFVSDTGYKTTAELTGLSVGIRNGKRGPTRGLNWLDPGMGFSQNDDHPVVHVSYTDAIQYIGWLNETLGYSLPPEYSFDLPTEAQWEYACRGNSGRESEFFWGDSAEDGRGKINAFGREHGMNITGAFPFNDGYLTTSPVGRFEPNDWGFFDMLGNVWEMCRDFYSRIQYSFTPKADPVGPSDDDYRVIRGGSFRSPVAYCRSAMRGRISQSTSYDEVGFRVAITRENFRQNK